MGIADAAAWSAGKDLLKAKVEDLKDALAGGRNSQKYPNVMQGDYHKQETIKTEDRFKLRSQIKWEKFMIAIQHALYLRLAEKRAMYLALLEKSRKLGNIKVGKQKDFYRFKDKLFEKYLKGVDKYREKLYKIWLKKEELKKGVKEQMDQMTV